MSGTSANRITSYRWAWCLIVCLGSSAGCDMIWGENEADSKSKTGPTRIANAASADNISFQEFDHLVTEVQSLRQELSQLREFQKQQSKPQEATTKSISHTGKVLLFFTATWCGPCQQMSPLINQLQRESLPIQTVDIDREPELAGQFGVSSIPFFQLVVAGKPSASLSGIANEKQLRKLIGLKWTSMEPVRDYYGVVSGEQLLSSAPEDGLLTDSQSFQKLCADWKLNRKDFDIDFSRQFLTVATACGSHISIEFRIDETGNLKVTETATCDWRNNSFSYCFAVMNRDGIRLYNGKELPSLEQPFHR